MVIKLKISNKLFCCGMIFVILLLSVNIALAESPETSAPNTNNTLWESSPLSTDQTLAGGSSVAIAEGKVFANCVGPVDQYGNPLGEIGAIVAFNKNTGEEIWNTSIDITAGGSWSSPAYNNEKIFTSTGQNTTCLNATTGEILWVFTNPTGKESCNGGPAIAEGKVVCSDWDGRHYYCLDENTGNELWNYSVSSNAQSTPAIYDNKIVVTSYNDVYCLDMEGNLLWSVPNPSSAGILGGSPSISDDTIYLTTYDFYGDTKPALFALSFVDGSQIWNAAIQRTDNTPTIAYGNLYVSGGCSGASESQTYCFNATTGELIWKTAKEWEGIGDWTCSPAVADGKVFIGRPAGTYIGQKGIVALDAFTGETIWESPNAGGTAVIFDGTLYSIGSTDSKVMLYAFEDIDWNPWNDIDSDGIPDGTYITISEVIEAYNCFRNGDPAPDTGEIISISKVINLYNAFRYTTPM